MTAFSATFTLVPDDRHVPVGVATRTPANVAAAARPVTRPFSPTSYWNTAFPPDAPIDPFSPRYVNDSLDPRHTQNYLRLTGGAGRPSDFATPTYWGQATDPVHVVRPSLWGEAVEVHIPRGARPAKGSDHEMTVFDPAFDQVVGFGGATHDQGGDRWSAESTDRYIMSSTGLAMGVTGAEDPRNFGHRGIPASVRAVRLDEILTGSIEHRLECYWWATADAHYWPMTGHERGRGGVVPEGIVIRIKPSVNLDRKPLSFAAKVLAVALQRYGCLIGDNSGSGNRPLLSGFGRIAPCSTVSGTTSKDRPCPGCWKTDVRRRPRPG